MDLGKTYQIKIPAALAEITVSKREVNGNYAVKTGKGYRVATELHYLSFFCILKAYSPNSSNIRYWTDEIDYVMSITNLSRRGIYKYLNKLKEMELLIPAPIQGDRRRKLSEFSLISWDKLATMYELSPFNKFIEITYEKGNSDHHPKYLIIQAEILHNQDKQAHMIAKKVKKFKQNYAQQEGTENIYSPSPKSKAITNPIEDRKLVAELSLLWAQIFRGYQADQSESENEERTTYFAFLRKINPSINRGLEGIRRSYSFSDLHRSIYLKKQLEKRGFGTFKRQVKIYSQVENRAPKYLLPQEDGTSKTKQMKPIYNRLTKQSGVWLTDNFIPTKQKTEA